MKKQLLIIAALFTAFNLSAQTQLPNSNFESWEDDPEFGINEPSDWNAPSFCISLNESKACNLYYEKADGYQGFAVKVIAKQDPESQDVNNSPLIYRGQLAQKPAKITFWYKSSKKVNATVLLSVGDLFEDENAESIAMGDVTVNTSSTFQKGQLSILNFNPKASDHIFLSFSFEEEEALADQDYFIVDNVELVYDLSPISDKHMAEFIGSNIITTSLELKERFEEIQVFNTTGVEVLKASETHSVDFSGLPEGLYMVTLKKDNAAGTMKVLKK